MAKWTEKNAPDQNGKIALVTGANSGLGLETAAMLAAKGAHVILACRNEKKAGEAMAEIRRRTPDADLEFLSLDLGSLASVREAAAKFSAAHERLDLLVNNAGLMMPPRGETADGFEQQIGVNHLGHFALTGLLLGKLLAAPDARVVSVSSVVHRAGRMNFSDLHSKRFYSKTLSYGQSKLANLLFMFELQRYFERKGVRAQALAAHPGYSSTNLQQYTLMGRLMNPIMAQDAHMGALPTLRAATDPGARGGDYYGPSGLGEMRGTPKKVGCTRAARSEKDARKLWKVSEEMTGVSFPS